jgi:hypothetical protein
MGGLDLFVEAGLLQVRQDKRHVAGNSRMQGTVKHETTMAITGTARDFAQALLQLTLKKPRSGLPPTRVTALPTVVRDDDATGCASAKQDPPQPCGRNTDQNCVSQLEPGERGARTHRVMMTGVGTRLVVRDTEDHGSITKAGPHQAGPARLGPVQGEGD